MKYNSIPLLRYRIHGKEAHKLPFHLDKATGQLRVKSKLNRVTKSSYELSVVAKLEGVEEKGFVDVIIEVMGSNSNCPQFQNLPENFRIKLKSRKGNVEIAKLRAEDSDEGSNAQITYKLISINGSDSHFSIDPLTGSVSSYWV
jgi:hypothetical protein